MLTDPKATELQQPLRTLGQEGECGEKEKAVSFLYLPTVVPFFLKKSTNNYCNKHQPKKKPLRPQCNEETELNL